MTVTAAFLKVNGFELSFDDLEAYDFLLGLYENGTMRLSKLEPWLREHATRRET